MKVLPHCLLATVESDSHMWNLVYLQLWLGEHGLQVKNLGSCTPIDAVLGALEQRRSDLLVVSSVNGHGYSQGLELIRQVRQRYPHLRCVIGGKLTTSEAQTLAVRRALIDAGYNQVFVGADAIEQFSAYLSALPTQPDAEPAPALCAPSWG
ncbi:cobalamin B12-binding domain-containing protein [Pseudomonas sp. SWRI81]|uniref:cobalamin B12-binding domain-containing protein n=1 Tax=Pseudomonas sp. SWRI81 TaxID=2745505 RepID=UPI00164723C3|nr:cobalamin B12-binding domain-containing protein [Pseudomonas sp. SWRI81]MBC3269431.1 cobalamin B12-binding domain-containing protein [Pseudomonas sp. SWRI81]